MFPLQWNHHAEMLENSESANLTLFSEARSVDEDGAARVAKDLAADAAVMSPPKRRELCRARVTARRDMV